jgi:hypothetical protein
LAGTSAAYFLLHSSEGPRARIAISAAVGAELQVTLVRLPRSMARLSLRWDKNRLILTAHDAAVTLDAAAWERLPPSTNRPKDTSYRTEESMEKTVRAWFGEPHIQAGASRHSEGLEIPGFNASKETVVFKIIATDAQGRKVATSVDVPPQR